MAETWLRVSTEPENRFPALSEWQEDVSMLLTPAPQRCADP
jgi:hypothetical protein